MSPTALMALISTLVVIIIIILGYFYNNRKFNQLETDINANIQGLVSQVNQTGFNKYELDVQQNSLLKSNAQTLKDLQQKETQDYAALTKKLEDLKYTEAEDMLRLSNDLTGIKESERKSVQDINDNISGMQSKLTNIGANVSILSNKVNAMPIDQQIMQINDIKSSIADITNYNNSTQNAISEMKDQIQSTETTATNMQNQLNETLGSYLKNSEFESYKLDVASTYAKLSDLSNYAQISEVQSNYATKSAFDDLQRTVATNNENVAKTYAMQSDLASYVTHNDMANYATKDTLASYSTTADLENYVLLDDYNESMVGLNHRVDDITTQLNKMPMTYGTKENIDNLISTINTANNTLNTIKAQYDNVISNYVTQSTFQASLNNTLKTENADANAIQELQNNVSSLVTKVGALPDTYLTISDAAKTYTPLTTTAALQNQIQSMPDQNMKNSIQSYLNGQYATPNDVQNIQRQIDKIGNPSALYATRADLDALQSKINMSTLTPSQTA